MPMTQKIFRVLVLVGIGVGVGMEKSMIIV